MEAVQDQLKAYVEYLRDLGIHDLYRRGEPVFSAPIDLLVVQGEMVDTEPLPAPRVPDRSSALPQDGDLHPKSAVPSSLKAPAAAEEAAPAPSLMPKPIGFNDLAPLPQALVPASERLAALTDLKIEIGDCIRCPLAYAGRHKIVFGNGDASARLLFVGEGPGADEDAIGDPFIGKAGQLLNNMIQAMGLQREQVYVANIVKCRPPANRVPEPVEANTCSPFLLRQIDIVRPQVIVALGATAALYLLGVKQSLASLRGTWHECRGARLAVTYHPAFLLRDPRQKSEAWKDLQMVMKELGLEPRPKSP